MMSRPVRDTRSLDVRAMSIEFEPLSRARSLNDPPQSPLEKGGGRSIRGAISSLALVAGLLWFNAPAVAEDELSGTNEAAAKTQPDESFESYRAHIAAAQASIRLGEYSKAKGWLDGAPKDYRSWEWDHIDAQLDESLEAFRCGVGPLLCLDVSPDGLLLATGGADGVVRLWETQSGHARGELRGHSGEVFSVRFSPDGKRIVSTSKDTTVRVWNIETKELNFVFERHDVPVSSADFSPDGSRIASCNYERLEGEPNPRIEGRVYIWNAHTGAADATLTTLAGGVKPLSSLLFTPDGKQIVAGSWGGSVFRWKLAPGSTPKPTEYQLPDEGLYNAVDDVDVSPKGTLIACASKDRTARVWHLDSGKLVATLKEHGGYVTAVAFDPKGRWLATAGQDDIVMLWDAKDWQLRSRLVGHGGAVRALSWSPRGDRLYSTGVDGSIRVWDPSYVGYGATINMNHGDACYAACFTPDGKQLFTCGYNGWANLWDADLGKRRAFWEAHPGASCNVLDLARDGRLLATCSWDKTVRIWDAESREQLAQFPVGEGVYSVAISPDSQFVAAAHGKMVSMWDIGSGRMIRRFTGHEAGITEVAFSKSGRKLASASSDRTARVWHVETGLSLAVMGGHADKVQSAAFDPTGAYLATGGDDGSVKLWSARTGELIRDLLSSNDPVYRVTFSPDGKRLAIASHELILVDPQRGATVARFRPHKDTVWNVQFSASGRRLATCSWDGTIAVLDTYPIRRRLGLPIQVETGADE